MQRAGEGDERMEKFKRYYETLLANYQAINHQLQTNEALSPEITGRLREKRKEIKANLQLLLAKLATSSRAHPDASATGQPAVAAQPAPRQQAAASGQEEGRQQAGGGGGKTLQQVASEVNPRMHLQEEAKRFLLEAADRFLFDLLLFAAAAAKHRGGECMEPKDVQHCLARHHTKRPAARPKGSSANEAHKQRLLLVKRASEAIGRGASS